MSVITHFFWISRPLNVLITGLAFLLACFIANGRDISFLGDLEFWFATACLIAVTATGYWVNDAFDFKIDRVNRPRRVIVNAHLSVKRVLTTYFVAVLLLLLFSFLVQPVSLTAVNFAAALLLFAYAALLKRTTVIGNLVVAALTALVIYYAALLYTPKAALFWAMLYAFEVNFIREVVKDIEDIEGDLRFKLQTLPIRAGIRGAKGVLYAAYSLFILSCPAPLVEEYWRLGYLNWPYLIASSVLVVAPACWLLRHLTQAVDKADFALQSRYLKWLIFAGMATLLFLH
jgi:4-hydroxybenzoate polyprenyltransferase